MEILHIFIEHLAVLLQHLKQICFLMYIKVCQVDYDINETSQFIFVIEYFGVITALSIFTEMFIFRLDEEIVFDCIEFLRV